MKNNVADWRDSYDYRSSYLSTRPGFFGHLHICSQCKKLKWGAGSIHVDHVIPPSSALRRSKGGAGFWRRLFTGEKKGMKKGAKLENTNPLAEALNTKVNLVAACAECNMKKSDKIGFVTVQGATAKVLEEALYLVQRMVFLAIGLTRLIINRFPFPKGKKKKTLKQLIPSAKKPGFFQTLLAVLLFITYNVLWYIVTAILHLAKFTAKVIWPLVSSAFILLFQTAKKPLTSGTLGKKAVFLGCYIAVLGSVVYAFIYRW